MNDPIDINTKITLVKKEKEVKELIFNKSLAIEMLTKSVVQSWSSWGKFQQTWCNRAYNTFKDYDKYILLIYLFRQVWQNYADNFNYYSLDEFYSNNEFVIDKINLIQISEELHIPKETIRRKVNEFQNEGILKRNGKTIILNKEAVNHQKPVKTVKLLSHFIYKKSLDLQNLSWFGDNLSEDYVEAFIKKHFTLCWIHFFRLQIPYLIRHRDLFGDLETWNVWGVIALNHQYYFNMQLKKSIIIEDLDFKDYYQKILHTKPSHAINASSISDISNIPRATVLRKLKWLVKNNLIKRTKNLQYVLKPKGIENKKINENFIYNQEKVSAFVCDILNMIKDPRFKIK